MKPTQFPEQTIVLQKPPSMSDEECDSLAVFQDPVEGYTLSRWKPSWRERLAILFGTPVWLWVIAGGRTQPPVALEAKRTPFVNV